MPKKPGSKKQTKPISKKKTAAKKAVTRRAVYPVRVLLDAEEHQALNGEVARRKASEPSGKVTRESVVRNLVRASLCPSGDAPALPEKTGGNALAVEQTKPSDDQYGRKMSVRVGAVTQVFRWVPPGTFTQGSPEGELGRWEDEGPQRQVKLQHGYWLADTPVTQALWEAVMGATANQSRFKGAERPVENVSWDDARGFLAKLNSVAPDLNLRLPTEAEWEHACRAGTTSATWVGNLDLDSNGLRAPILDPIAWYYANSSEGTQPVKGKGPNPIGLYDMLGNVYEWCSDFFGPYSKERVTDPTGPAGGSRRVVRGGCWLSRAGYVRAAYRYGNAPRYRSGGLGFRLARGHRA